MTAKRRMRQMTQHFLLSPAAKTLTLASVARMGDEEAERVFMRLRWANGEPHCPRCGCFGLYQQRRATGLAPLALQSLLLQLLDYQRDDLREP